MKTISIHKLQLQFDDNGTPVQKQAQSVIDLVNEVLRVHAFRVGCAQIFAHRDEIEITQDAGDDEREENGKTMAFHDLSSEFWDQLMPHQQAELHKERRAGHTTR